MTSLLHDAVAHHVWATQRVIDACEGLTPEQLVADTPGTYGPIIATLGHLVGADASYLSVLTGGAVGTADTDTMDVAELHTVMEANGDAWSALVAQDLDPTIIVTRYRDDGSAGHAPLGIRMAQALHHGTDHRSQVCTALTIIGVEPPFIDVWDFADSEGRLSETPPAP
jgi:uncharacterized damage-inducible protein DinB